LDIGTLVRLPQGRVAGPSDYVRIMAVMLEVCVTSVEEAEVAASCGVDSVEVCSWLACGGITPSSGLVDAMRSAVKIPVRVLVRPGPGGFIYSPAETLALLTDVEVFGGGAIGLVTGALEENGSLNERVLASVMRLAPESEITFHRAIDHAADMPSALDRCMELGVHRVLTSGGSTLAMDGAAMLKQLVARAGEQLTVAAAGGINATNVVELIERTGVMEVHFAAQRPKPGKALGAAMSSANVGVNFETEPDRAKIEGVMNALAKAGLR